MRMSGWKTASMLNPYDIVNMEDIVYAVGMFEAREARLRNSPKRSP